MLLLAQEISVTDMALILLYLGITAYLGWLGYRHTKTAADYMVAGRKVHPFLMAMSYGATFISTSAIVGFGGVAAMFGMSLLWLTFLNIFVGIFIALVVLGGPTRRMGHALDAHTFPELLGRRFQSKALHVLAGLVIFIFMPLYTAAVLIGGTEFIAHAFHAPYTVALLLFAVLTAAYVLYGGLKGVLYTDAFQGSIMTVGMLVLLIGAYAILGGVAQGHKDLTAMKDQVFVGFKSIGHQGWTEMPRFGWGPYVDPATGKANPAGYNLWWIVVSTIVMGVGIGVLAQPQLVVRFLTVKSGKELNRALVYGGTFILLMTGVAFTVGALSNVYFFKHEKIHGVVRDFDMQKVIAKQDPGREPVRIPCYLMHLDTTGSGLADTHIVFQGVGKAAGIMPRAGATLKDGPAVTIPAAATQPADVLAFGQGLKGRAVVVEPRATAFLRTVVQHGQDWMFNSDSIIPTFITSAMPRWFRILFMLTLLAAAMSTMSSQFHALGTAIGHDVVAQLSSGSADSASRQARTIFVVRVGIVVGLVLAVVLGYYARGGYFIARATAIFFGLCASAFLPTFVGGLFWRRMTKAGAIASMVAGFLVTAFWLLFVKEAEAGAIGLVRMVTPALKDAAGVVYHPNSILYDVPNWPVVDPLVVALPISALTAVVVSLMTRPPEARHLDKCFAR